MRKRLTKEFARIENMYIDSENVIFEEGCNKCKDCGNSACS